MCPTVLIKKKEVSNSPEQKGKRMKFLKAHYVPDTLHILAHIIPTTT